MEIYGARNPRSARRSYATNPVINAVTRPLGKCSGKEDVCEVAFDTGYSESLSLMLTISHEQRRPQWMVRDLPARTLRDQVMELPSDQC
jgi:hypothetical protein